MALAELLLAGVLLTGPELPSWAEDPAIVEANFPLLRHVLLSTAVEWEILDQRELRFTMTRPSDFAYDLSVLQQRYRDLADAPPLADVWRFAEPGLLHELIAFNRHYRNYLETIEALEVANSASLRAALVETDRLYAVYDSLRNARCEYYYVFVRRLALKRLRDLIGEEEYLRGELPPNVPIWRMRLIQ